MDDLQEEASFMDGLVVFIACDCMVWPLDPLTPYRACGACGVKPHTRFDPPSDGKAHPIDWYLENA